MECADNSLDTKKVHSIEELLKKEKYIVYKIEGKSMEPMLCANKDIVIIIEKGDKRCKENDVVLYRKNNKLILHRIIQVLPQNQYVVLGDNCSKKEHGITDEDIIGILTAFKHNGTHYELNNPKYQAYVRKLRSIENIRIKKKLLYDLISWNIKFLPSNILTIIKTKLKKILFVNKLDF